MIKNTSKEGIGAFAGKLIEEHGAEIAYQLIKALISLLWKKEPAQDGGVTTQGDGHNCKPSEYWDETLGKCMPRT